MASLTSPPHSRTPREVLQAYAAGGRDFANSEFQEGAVFAKACLRGACSDGSWLFDVDFHGADLREASFQNCNLKCADFSGADLRGASFAGASIEGVSVNGARLEGASVAGATAHGHTFTGDDGFPDFGNVPRRSA